MSKLPRMVVRLIHLNNEPESWADLAKAIGGDFDPDKRFLSVAEVPVKGERDRFAQFDTLQEMLDHHVSLAHAVTSADTPWDVKAEFTGFSEVEQTIIDRAMALHSLAGHA
ncbi:MAG TPA: hypothetical protein VGI91_09115 [Steroidobacteraceae bacterium]|jgi:hypothetical protein